MNATATRKLALLKAKVKNIESACQCILMDIEEIQDDDNTAYDNLCIIENNFRSIHRVSDEAVDAVMVTYDELEEK